MPESETVRILSFVSWTSTAHVTRFSPSRSPSWRTFAWRTQRRTWPSTCGHCSNFCPPDAPWSVVFRVVLHAPASPHV